MYSIEIVIPCFNGESRLEDVFGYISEIRKARINNDNIKLIFSDNNSSDNSLKLAQHSNLFDVIVARESTLLYDNHIHAIALEAKASYVYPIGVNYCLDPDLFIQTWRLIRLKTAPPALILIYSRRADDFPRVTKCSAYEYLCEAGPWMGGIGAQIFSTEILSDSFVKNYSVGSRWKFGQTGWIHVVATYFALSLRNKSFLISKNNIVLNNPAGINRPKDWFKGLIPIYIRIHYIAIAIECCPEYFFLDYRVRKQICRLNFIDSVIVRLSARRLNLASFQDVLEYSSTLSLGIKFNSIIVASLLFGLALYYFLILLERVRLILRCKKKL